LLSDLRGKPFGVTLKNDAEHLDCIIPLELSPNRMLAKNKGSPLLAILQEAS